ncbi:hypothetical protein PG985_009847 [Apiospora marii]|uniref:Cytochrome b5 heme-binding domain-containing protein n=1 Tax=Apiospora marii TaxID=335849 RepID=A0ABR1RQN0_9PEZI
MPVIPVDFPSLKFPGLTLPSLTLPSVSFPSFTRNITIPTDLVPSPTTSNLSDTVSTSEPTLTADNVVAGLAAIGLNKGWVIFMQIVLVLVVVGFVLFMIGVCTAGCMEESWKKDMEQDKDSKERIKEYREFKKFQKLHPGGLDAWKASGKDLEQAKVETTGQQSDTASFKTCVE